MAKYHVGVDVSKSKHKACVRDLSQDSYSKVFSFDVNREGFEKFSSFLDKFSLDKEDFTIGIEATGNYGLTLSYFLLSQGYKVAEINPYQANQFRKAQGKKAKTDHIDARSLAAILSLENHKPLSLPDGVMDNLRELTRFRADMVKDRSRLVNQLHNDLICLFPEFLDLFKRLHSTTSLALLISYPGPEYISKAGEEVISKSIATVSHGRIGKEVAKALIEAAKDSVGIAQRQKALSTKLSILGRRIVALNGDIERVEREIEDLFKDLPYDPGDFPIGDTASLATIISEIEDVNRFPTLKQFLSHFGWCPQSFQTGSYQAEHPKMSHAGNRYVRRIIWMLSIASIRSVPFYSVYFQKRVKEGKAKMDIIVAIGKKLLSVFYAILKTGVPYNPNWEVNSHSSLART